MPQPDKDKLTAKLSELREKEREMHERQGELADLIVERDTGLTPDEITEQKELDDKLKENRAQQDATTRALQVGPHSPEASEEVGLDEQERRDFSILNLVRAQMNPNSAEAREQAKLELEASDAIAKKLDLPARPGAVYVPMEIGERAIQQAQERIEQRDLISDVFGQGGAFIGVDWRPNMLIELLRNNMIGSMMGVRFIDGLMGDVQIPKHTGAGTVAWLPRDGTMARETDPTTGTVSMTPRTLAGYTDFTRGMQLQSSIGMENFVRENLMQTMAREKDRVIFHGDGIDGEPQGVEATDGVHAVDITNGDPTRTEMIKMVEVVESANASMGSLSFATTPAMFWAMYNKAIDTGSGRFLIENGQLIGMPVHRSTNLEAGKIFYGNWSDVIIGSWSNAMELLVDPYTQSRSGTVRVIVFESCDIVIRHGESFSLGQ